MKNTKIEWAHHTVNFWWGCAKVSPACEHCYAETLAKMWSKGRATWGANGKRWLRVGAAVEELLALDKAAVKAGVRWRVFINSMSDIFEDRRDLDGARAVLAATVNCVPHLDLLLLTKRPELVSELVPVTWLNDWPKNVWVGTTVENQTLADERIPALLRVPAAVRFLSCEPLLGPLEFSNVSNRSDAVRQLGKPALAGIHWVIGGGESGPGARALNPEWVKSLRDQCADAGTPFFFKQWGEFCANEQLAADAEYPENASFRMFGETAVWRVGKKTAGRLLDGVEHSGVPA